MFDLLPYASSISTTVHQPAFLISYTYDKVGNRLSMIDATGTTTYYRDPYYNRYYNVDAITNPQGRTVEFSYDYLGRRTGRTLPNGVTTTYSYDATSRLLSLVHSGVSSFNYTYDGVGNRLSMATGAGTHSYAYDNIYQLTQATHPASPTEAFAYDGVGNRLSSAEFPSWTYNVGNQLTGYDGTSYTYDSNGNMVTKTDASGTTAYTYNAENQLVRIDFPGGGFAEYVYDAMGRRIGKNVDGTITRYIYDGEDILFEYDGTNTIIARYTHGPGIDEPLIMERGGISYYYHADGLGSITEVTDSSGTVVASYKYDSFGKIVAQTGSIINPYTYTGREYDPESELYYYRNRYYDPEAGRFLTLDLISLNIGINMYVYVKNNPIKYIDPLGLKEICFPWFSIKSDWKPYRRSQPYWHLAGTIVQIPGVSGLCWWQKIVEVTMQRGIIQRELCFDTCEYKSYTKRSKLIHYEYKEVKEIIDCYATPIRWFGHEYDCWVSDIPWDRR